MKKIITNKDREKTLIERGQRIIESFQNGFDKIKRIDEDFDWSKYEKELSDEELEALADEDSDYEDKANKAWINKNTQNEATTPNSDTYFETLSEALDSVRNKVARMGYSLDEDSMMFQFGTGGISYGETKRSTIELLKDGNPILSKSGKPMNRGIVISITRMDSGRYELTAYKSW